MMKSRIVERGLRNEVESIALGVIGLSRSSILDPRSSKGFTLVEMIMVIVITGIIGGMVAVFIRAPMQGYVDSARRAEMTDTADTALRRISRDLRLALPNSIQVNVAAGVYYVDFLSTSGGGRYRANGAGTTYCPGGDVLSFTAADTCFEILGLPIQFRTNDQVVIYNLGIPGADAYDGNTTSAHVRRAYSGSVAGPVQFVSLTSANRLPFESPTQRFHVVHEQVRYICNPTAQTLTRYALDGSAIVAPSAAVPGVPGALLASQVTGCRFEYNPYVVAQRTGLLTMQLTLTDSNESVTLYNATHVSNEP